jgi:type II secretory pathway pseudopilin PulG
MRMTKFFHKDAQRGDTIIEVLMALTVIGLIIGVFSVLSNESSSNLQQTQERGVAQRIARGQLEYLKSYVRTLQGTDISTVSALTEPGFCMVSDNGEDDGARIPKKSDVECTQSQTAGGASYTTAIVVNEVETGIFDVNVKVTWDGLTVNSGNVDVNYRMYNITGAQVALQSGQLCADGYKKDDVTKQCVPLDPAIKVTTRLITADRDGAGGAVEPSCGKAEYTSLNNIQIRVSELGVGAEAPQIRRTQTPSTGGLATALFTPLKKGGTYSVQRLALPSDVVECGSASAGPFVVNEGAEREVFFTARPRVPVRATVNVASRTFPTWHLYNSGGSRHYQDFTFTNPGATASLNNIQANLSDTTHYWITLNNCYGSLAPGASCTVRVYFWPPAGTPQYNYLGNAGIKNATLTLTNSNGVTTTSAILSGKTVSDMMRPNDAVTIAESDLLRSYHAECYNDADSCGYYRNYIAGNGNLYIMNSYCAYRGDPEYNGSNASIQMQGDGNFVFYGTDNAPRWYTATSGSDMWMQVLGNGYGRITQGYNGPEVKWLNGSIGGCNPTNP